MPKTMLPLLVVMTCAIGSSSALASPVVDQCFYSPDARTSLWAVVGDIDTISDVHQGQTFVVEMNGNLSKIEFPVWVSYLATPQLSWTLVSTLSDGRPSNEVLASGITTIPISTNDPISVDINLANPLAVTYGQRLAIELGITQQPKGTPAKCEIGGASSYFWPYYEFGSLFSKSASGEWEINQGSDLFFISYVDPVPEPSSILALLVGVGGMGGMVWRRKSA